jgi:replicative DNA helicase
MSADTGHEYERALLGAILQEPALLDTLPLDVSLFEDGRNRAVFEAARGLHAASKPVDIIAVSQAVDGKAPASYIAGLTNVPTAGNAWFYFEELLRAAKGRQLRRIAAELGREVGAGESVEERIARALVELHELQIKGAEAKTLRPREVIHEIIAEAEHRTANKITGLTGIPSGIDGLDLMTGGFQAGDLILIGARTSVGKSALALTFIEHEIAHDFPVALVTLEMSGRQVLERLLAMRSGIGTGRLRLGFLNTQDFATMIDAAGRIAEQDLRLLDRPGADLAMVAAWVRAEVGAGAKIAYLDYAGLISGGDSRTPHWERMAEVSHGLKTIARENHVPLVALVQLGRAAVENGPGLENVRGSGAFEEDADIALLLQRSEAETTDEDIRGELIVAKHRNGPTGRMKLLFHRTTTTFREVHE